VPFPPDYGGAMDVFYRLLAFQQLGVKVHLHCFEYGRGMPEELKKYVYRIHYYKRKKNIADSLSRLPFIVRSRDSRQLIRILLNDDHPILFEGLHSCYYLKDKRLKKRFKMVRMHNIEHDYYLALSEASAGWKKRFFFRESKKLKRFEPVLKHADLILAIKEGDAIKLQHYGTPTHVLPASLMPLNYADFSLTQPFCFYHGNLSVRENERAVEWLITEVFLPLNMCESFKVAGKNPSEKLITLCTEHGVEIIPDPSEEVLNDLLKTARVHVFYSDQSTGVKLKLLRSLLSPGHVIVNQKMIEGTDLLSLCDLALIAEDFKELVLERVQSPLSEAEFLLRINYLREHYDTLENCRKVKELIP
jgi:hypothetical protein